MRIYLEFQIYSRDFDSNLLLAIGLTAYGHEVIFGRDFVVRKMAMKDADSIYLGNQGFTYPASYEMKKLIRKNLIPVYFCEEVTAVADYLVYKKMRLNSEAIKLSYFLPAFNMLHRELIKLESPKREKDIKILGNIRFDLVKPRYSSIYLESVKNIQSKFGKFVLVLTNGSIGNSGEYLERRITQWKKNGNLPQDFISYYKDYLELRSKSQLKFIHEVVEVAKLNPNIKFIIRAKWQEKKNIYLLLNDSLPNIILESTGSIYPWVLSATKIIMNNCTSAFDAYCANCPVIFHHPEQENQKISPNIEVLAHHTFSINQLSALIKTDIEPKKLTTEKAKYFLPFVKKYSLKSYIKNISNIENEQKNKYQGKVKISTLANKFYNLVFYIYYKYVTRSSLEGGTVQLISFLKKYFFFKKKENQKATISFIGPEIFVLRSKKDE